MKFSLVMPVYNVEKTLPASIESVLGQDFDDWELLCVDDGSKDGSAALLDAYAARDARIRVFHRENAGVGEARNLALSKMTGDYFLFLDSDDLLLRGTLSRLHRLLDESRADGLLTCPLYREFDPSREDSAREWTADMTTRVVLDADRRKRLVFDQDAPKGFVCGRVYRTSVFGHLRFPVWFQMMEDLAYWFEALGVPARWHLVNGTCYGYRLTVGSASRVRGASFYYDVLSMPRQCLPSLARDLELTEDELRRAWHRMKGAYSGFVRSLCLQWKTFPAEQRQVLEGELESFRTAFSFEPLSFLTRIRVWCLFHGVGDGAWIDWIEGPLTRMANRLRQLKRRVCQ